MNINIQQGDKKEESYLERYGKDITKLAREGKLLPCIGRENEIMAVAQTLMRKIKNNPVLIGEAGVGKTSIVEGFAKFIMKRSAPLEIKDFRVIEINIGSVVAGTIYRGMFEERIQRIIKEASTNRNIVLFIDEIHLVIDAGKAIGAPMDAANLLKPALARGEIKLIGATTPEEYRKYIQKDSAFERRLQPIWVSEPSREETITILEGLKSVLKSHHGIIIPNEVIEKAVDLSVRYIRDFRLPDKAIDIIDQACAAKVFRNEYTKGHDRELNMSDVVRIVSEKSRIPVEDLTKEESRRLLGMEDYLRSRIFGQDRAIKEIADSIRMAKAGLRDSRKPLGVFLFLGSTGIGKTELAKSLAEFLFYDGNHFITLDMSEYREGSSVGKLIGSSPGYIGYEDGGYLTERVRRNPYSVILLDEIEKACPEVFNIFLQVFEEGRLTDSHGREVNFSECVIIMTSNVGTFAESEYETALNKIGFEEVIDREQTETKKEREGEITEEEIGDYQARIVNGLYEVFRPEFLNRIQKIIIFNPLDKKVLASIVEKFEKELNEKLSSKGIMISLSQSTVDFLIEKGYSKIFGARELKRAFENYISEPLANLIIKGKIRPSRAVNVTVKGGEIKFGIENIHYIYYCTD